MLEFFSAVSLEELSLAVMLFGLLVFLWAVTKLPIVERIMMFFANSVWHALLLFGGGFIVCCGIAYLA